MEEKPKRKEKPKNKAKRGNNTMTTGALTLLVIFLLGLGLTIFFIMQPSKEQLAFELTSNALETQNAIAMTDISASATFAIIDTRQSPLYDLYLTATALNRHQATSKAR